MIGRKKGKEINPNNVFLFNLGAEFHFFDIWRIYVLHLNRISVFILGFTLADLTCQIQPIAITVCRVCVAVIFCTGQTFNAHASYEAHAHTSPLYEHQIYGIYCQFGGYIYFWPISGNNRWSKSCSWLCFGIYICRNAGSICHVTYW